MALLTGLAFGLAPALLSSRTNFNSALKEGGRDARASAHGNRVRSALVVAEVSLALMLLVGAGLLIKSFINLQHVDPGFNAKGALRVDVGLPRVRYTEPTRAAAFFKQLIGSSSRLCRVSKRPARCPSLPLSGGGTDTSFLIEGRPSLNPIASLFHISRR